MLLKGILGNRLLQWEADKTGSGTCPLLLITVLTEPSSALTVDSLNFFRYRTEIIALLCVEIDG
jgi:hypothetical protein